MTGSTRISNLPGDLHPTPHPGLSRPTSQRLLTMAALTSLASETLVEILSLLSCPDLASTARVSNRFQLLSQPLLYTAPCLRRSPEMPNTRATGTSLEIFLRALLTPGRETLASHVRTLHFEFENISVEPGEEYWSGYTTPTELHAITSDTPQPQPQGRQLMILLDLLPRLQILHFSPPNYRPSFSRLLESAADDMTLPCGLNSLREVHCPPTDDSDGVRWHTLRVFLQLPQIRRIEVTCINRFRSSEISRGREASSSTVTHLRFSHSDIPDWLLSNVLLIPIALTHFSYSIVPSRGFLLSEFIATLGPLRPSLQSLHLDFGNMVLPREPQLPQNDSSLREWPVLRTISCPLIPLLGGGPRDRSPRLMNVLPPSLRELEILWDSCWSFSDAVDQIVEMLAEKRWAVPYLERLAVVAESGMAEGVLDNLVVACEAAGVSFVKDSFCW